MIKIEIVYKGYAENKKNSFIQVLADDGDIIDTNPTICNSVFSAKMLTRLSRRNIDALTTALNAAINSCIGLIGNKNDPT